MQTDGPAGRQPVTHHPPRYRARPLHLVLMLSNLIGRISPLALAPAWIAMAAIASWPWGSLRVASGLLALSFTVVDGVCLALLPRRGRSFGPVTPPLLALAMIHTVLALTVGLARQNGPALLTATGLNLAVSGAFVYASWVEPFRIKVTRERLGSPELGDSAPLRLLHLTDLHVERISSRERTVVKLVEKLAPDLIVLTGDYLNLSYVEEERAQSEARDLLSALCGAGRCPCFAVTGSPPVDLAGVVPEVFHGLPITWLVDETTEVRIRDHALRIAGLTCTRDRSRDVPRLRRLISTDTPRPFTLLLYHSPDLMPEAAELGIDLYLCGHTHGGQIRLPLFGALITSSDFWKRYEMGRYRQDGTTLYVNRGLGMEGMGAPRARFLAPPEVVLWTLSAGL